MGKPMDGSVTPIGKNRQLFLDDWILEKADGLVRRPGTVTRHPDNPVLRRDKPWEKARNELYGSVVWDEESELLKAFYTCMSVPYDGKLAYAESGDGGVTWHKPDLDVCRINDGPTNIVWPGCRYVAGPSVFIDSHERDPSRRYKLFTCDYVAGDGGADRRPTEGIYVAHSPDGIHWSGASANPVFQGLISDAGQCVFRDPVTGTFVAFVRLRPDGWRSVGMMESADFETWTEPVLICTPTDEDRAKHWHFYGLSVTPYEGLYVGLLWIFPHVDASFDVKADSPVMWQELVVSRDGREWHRVAYGEPFLPPGPAGAFDHRQIRTASSLVVLHDRVLLAYSGSPHAHVREAEFDIGVATIRKDGFACLEAGDAGGMLLTKPFQHSGCKLMINARTEAGGHVKAEIMDGTGHVIEGHTAERCCGFAGDTLGAQLVWAEAESVLSREDGIRVRFLLEKAQLYSFWLDA